MPEKNKKIVCPRCGMPLADNLPNIKLELDFNKRECFDYVYCAVCGADITNLPDKGRYGYSAMVSVKHKGTPPWEKGNG